MQVKKCIPRKVSEKYCGLRQRQKGKAGLSEGRSEMKVATAGTWPMTSRQLRTGYHLRTSGKFPPKPNVSSGVEMPAGLAPGVDLSSIRMSGLVASVVQQYQTKTFVTIHLSH